MRLHAVAIVIPDYDAAIDFYVGKLGFSLIQDTRLSSDKRWVLIAPDQTAQTKILLAKADGPAQDAAIGSQTGGRVGFFLETDEFDATYERMLKARVHFEETPRTEVYGKVVVWQDPWGNRWDLLQLI